MGRHCSACNRYLPRDSYSRNQWTKAIGVSRCNACVHGVGKSSNGNPRAADTARRNNATSAQIQSYDMENPFAEGGFRWVAKGVYTEGKRQGENCVCKWFKTGMVDDHTFFDLDIKAMNKALGLIKEWNSRNFISKTIMINIPTVWTFSSGRYEGMKTLIEPFISNYTKFNSNSGWADDSTPWPRVMQALSHFSYHISGGQYVLCDLQGGIYSNAVVLTDPVILSRDKDYGITDLGLKGISSFFNNHKCNEFCKPNWSKPRDCTQYYQPQMGTSMIATGAQKRVPTHLSRHAMTGLREAYCY